MSQLRALSWLLVAAGVAAAAEPASRKRYGPGASDTEIKIGNISPYSGPASAYGEIGRTLAAFFDKVNAEGGINGRRIKFVSYDGEMAPAKTVEQARKLVEGDGVLLIFQSVGTAANQAIQKYMNDRKVPQLFVSSPATRWGDPSHFPWTMGFQPNCQSEGRIYARYLLDNHPAARIGILYQNDDFGKDCAKGLKDGLGSRAGAMIVSEQSYELSDPTVDSQLVNLKASGADAFFDVATPKFATQAIRKAHQMGWKPVHLLVNASASIGSVLKPAGLEASTGILTASFGKDILDPARKDDPDVKGYYAFLERYRPDADRMQNLNSFAYIVGNALVQVLKQCGDDLTRENVMRQAASLKDVELPLLAPGVKVNTSPRDYFPIEQFQMRRFDGERWRLFGPVLNGEIGSS
jgi:branched-chain amino acid transport system substrate-binding protein